MVSQKSGFIYEYREKFAGALHTNTNKTQPSLSPLSILGDHPPLDEVVSVCERFIREHPYEQWSAVVHKPKNWAEVIVRVLTTLRIFARYL